MPQRELPVEIFFLMSTYKDKKTREVTTDKKFNKSLEAEYQMDEDK